jgi:hypothetical protein
MPRVDKYSTQAKTKLRVQGQDIVLPELDISLADLARRRLNALHADPRQLEDLKAQPDTTALMARHLKAAARAQGLI